MYVELLNYILHPLCTSVMFWWIKDWNIYKLRDVKNVKDLILLSL